MDVDLGDLVDLEQQFYDIGYKEGVNHGREHGLIEGRMLGKEKGFEIWEELGFYLGFAAVWLQILRSQSDSESRSVGHISHLLELIRAFPMHNPSKDHELNDFDIIGSLNRIRGRYKAVCASLGVKPRLISSNLQSKAADNEAPSLPDISQEDQESTNKPRVWSFMEAAKKAGTDGLSF
ncbi:hypothetical protein PIIN_01575 [Serendipita indica DSM 11827]|uniref:Essential protein Yae1 N-terminal domain-containing protein n=1 Tax=Serendipita indica (strain DSM 11827) TaxID=1109443 RepID=G4T8U9_SERID|nr:hypothetical protein PIIN_01575 [Serendipita indica DSM 11827]